MSFKMAEERPSLDEEVKMNNIWLPWIRKGLIFAAAAVLLFSSYKVAAYFLASSENKKTYTEIRQLYDSGNSELNNTLAYNQVLGQVKLESKQQSKDPLEKSINLKFTELIKQNPDIVGWIKINSTQIDYPVTKTSDNSFYLDNDVNKQKNVAGAIFMDYRNLVDGFNRNIILYGHDMRTGAMFANLLGYQSKWNFDNKSIIEFDTLYADEKWQIFSAYTTDSHFDYIKTDFRSNGDYLAFLKTIQAKSIHTTTIELTEADTILTLSTCSSAASDARFVVHAKLIKGDL